MVEYYYYLQLFVFIINCELSADYNQSVLFYPTIRIGRQKIVQSSQWYDTRIKLLFYFVATFSTNGFVNNDGSTNLWDYSG